jgi:outer membrane protein insertion porin family
MKCIKSWLLIFLLCSPSAYAFDSFVIQDIRVEGLQRISLGTTFNYLPLKVGETLTKQNAAAAVRALYKTGFFEDVRLEKDGNDLLIVVVERPSIAKITVYGNEDIEKEQLDTALKGIGLAEGRIFNRSMLDQVEQELLRQYFVLGKYGVEIETTITPLERNRVDVEIDIKEGSAAKIRQINIIGAEKIDETRLLDEFNLSTPGFFSGISNSGKYSKQEFQGDLELLRSYYLDRGYIKFSLDSTQVSITPDKRDIYLTINISEGEQYNVRDVKIAGDPKVPEAELRELLQIKPGDVFSRRAVSESVSKISERLGHEGYAFANVNAIPDVDDKKKLVGLTFFIDPGNRVYVRRINISGNTKTLDKVVRREIRQMEGGWLSTPLVDRSKIRLQKLGFFETVNVETPRVPGTNDQVDLNFDVTEGSTGNFTAGMGYGDAQGFLFNMSVTLNNFAGSGKRISTEVNNSKVNTIYRFSYLNPYYTNDGISRGFDVVHRSTNADAANLGDFSTNVLGGSMNMGFPLTEYSRANWSLGFENTDLTINKSTAPQYYSDWVDMNGDNYDTITTSLSWSYDTRNRAIFPEWGSYSYLSGQVAVPGGDLEYYKLSLRQKWYAPITDSVIFFLGGDFAYGDGFGDTSALPFFENYYAGGSRSVRGYRGNTLGPRDAVTNDPIGGNKRIVGHAEIYFPWPFAEEGAGANTFRMSAFLDAGNVFGPDEVVDLDQLRSSYGLSAMWLTPVGALSFNWGWAINDKPGDETEVFQFTIGAPF